MCVSFSRLFPWFESVFSSNLHVLFPILGALISLGPRSFILKTPCPEAGLFPSQLWQRLRFLPFTSLLSFFLPLSFSLSNACSPRACVCAWVRACVYLFIYRCIPCPGTELSRPSRSFQWEDGKDGAAHFRAQPESGEHREGGDPGLHVRANQTRLPRLQDTVRNFPPPGLTCRIPPLSLRLLSVPPPPTLGLHIACKLMPEGRGDPCVSGGGVAGLVRAAAAVLRRGSGLNLHFSQRSLVWRVCHWSPGPSLFVCAWQCAWERMCLRAWECAWMCVCVCWLLYLFLCEDDFNHRLYKWGHFDRSSLLPRPVWGLRLSVRVRSGLDI